jgi:3D (Asp-Asp-Asp) domain-containing protein
LTNTTLLRNSLGLSKSVLSSLFRLPLATKTRTLLALVATLLVLLGTAAARTSSARKANRNSAVYTVTATAYEAVIGQTDSKPFITADNSRIPRGYGSHTRWLALSRDLLQPWGGPFEFGDKVRVRGVSHRFDGVYTVHDTMNRRYRHRLDLLVHPRERISINQPGVQLQRLSRQSSSAAVRKPTRARATARRPAHAPKISVRKKLRTPRKAAPIAKHKRAAKPTKKPRAPRKALPLAKHKSSSKKARSVR